MNAQTTGTIKIGRWTYGAKNVDGVVTYEKKDGHIMVATPKQAEAFVADVVEVESQSDLNEVETTVLAMIAKSAMNVDRYFDFFDGGLTVNSGIWFEHAAQQTQNPPAARKAFRSIAKKGYLEIGPVETEMGEGTAPDAWMVLTAQGAKAGMSLLDFEVNDSVLGAAPAAHRTGGGNQTKKPGKSTWKIGEACPQGHTLTADTLYIMPSGRKQCKACRAEMPSRKG